MLYFIFDVKFFWTETKGSRQNKQDIFSKKKRLTTKRNSEVFFEDLAWKTNFQEKLFKKREKQWVFKNETGESKIFFAIFPKTERQFFKRPQKKIDKRKSRTVISRKTTNQKNMERTRQQHDARRKKQ